MMLMQIYIEVDRKDNLLNVKSSITIEKLRKKNSYMTYALLYRSRERNTAGRKKQRMRPKTLSKLHNVEPSSSA